MRLDIRIPIGAMFALLGAILTVYGLVSDKAIYERSLDINVNFWWGLVLLAFGAAMYWLGRRGAAAVHTTEESVEGRNMEDREQRAGLEKESPRRGH